MDCWSIEHDYYVRDADEEEEYQLKVMEEEENYFIEECIKVEEMEKFKKFKVKFLYLEGSFGCGKSTILNNNFKDVRKIVKTFKMDFMDVMDNFELEYSKDMRQLVYLNKVDKLIKNMWEGVINNCEENRLFLVDRYGVVSSGIYWLIGEFMEEKENFDEIYKKIELYIDNLPELNDDESMMIFINEMKFGDLRKLINERGYDFEVNMDDEDLKKYRYIQNWCFNKLFNHYKLLNCNVFLRNIGDFDELKNNIVFVNNFIDYYID